MPAWIHDRAEHLLAKNPSMDKSTAFAIATQQGHKLGKNPKKYGTKEGKQEANWTHIGRVYKMVEDKNGDYFVSDGATGRITKFKRDGTVIGFFDITTFANIVIQNTELLVQVAADIDTLVA